MKVNPKLGGLAITLFLLISIGSVEAEEWRLANSIRFSPRQRFGAAVMDGRIFVAGGMRMGMTQTMTNDVWSSRDGDSWGRLAADPPFAPRQDPSLTAFKGKLWLVGGKDEGFRADKNHPWFSDIWTSLDGKEWTQFEAAFLPEGTERILSFADSEKLLLIAMTPRGVSVFSSRDGIAFLDLKAKGLQAVDAAYAWAGTLFAYPADSSRIFSSRDGIDWKANAGPASSFLSNPAPLGRGSASLLYAICKDGFRTSKDGLSWIPVKYGLEVPGLLKLLEEAESASYSETVREGAALVSLDAKLWIIGGALGSRNSSPGASFSGFYLENELWESGDGKAWKRHPGPSYEASPLPRYGQAAAVHLGRFFILGGATDPADERLLADSWALGPDGVWERLGPEESSFTWTEKAAIWMPRYNSAAASFHGRLWLAGGQTSGDEETGGFRSDVWSSDDGASWRLETPKAAFGPRAGHSLIVHSGKLWILGGLGPNPENPEEIVSLADAFVSEDGVNWSKAQLDPAPRLASFQAAASAGGRIWLSGGTYRIGKDGYITRETWSSTDGLAWRRESSLDSFVGGAAGGDAGGRFAVVGGFYRGDLVPGVFLLQSEGDWISGAGAKGPDPGYLGSLAAMGGKLWYWAGLDDSDGPPSGALWCIPLSGLEP